MRRIGWTTIVASAARRDKIESWGAFRSIAVRRADCALDEVIDASERIKDGDCKSFGGGQGKDYGETCCCFFSQYLMRHF